MPSPATTSQVYNAEGQAIQTEFIPAAIAEGRAHFDNEAEYSMVDADGLPKLVPGTQVWNALQQGWTVESDGGRQSRLRQESAGVGTALGAAALGAAETLTFGAAPGLAEAFAPDGTVEAWRDITEASPTAHSVGEVLGIFTPMGVEAAASKGLLKGAGGLAAEGATALPRALGGAAKRAGAGVERMLPRATGGLGQAMVKGARMGTEGLIEGAGYGAGMAITEASLGDKELTAERLLAAAGEGALLGGGIGFGLGAAGPALKGAAGKLDAKGMAERAAWKSTGATGAQTRKIGLDQAKQSGRRMLDEGLVKFESLEERAVALKAAAQSAGKDIDRLITGIDDLGHKPDLAPIVQRIDEQLGALRQGLRPGEDARLARKLDKEYAAPLREAMLSGGGSFKSLHGFRARVDDYLQKAKQSGDTTAYTELGKLRGAIEDGITGQADNFARAAGGDFASGYSAAKARYKDLIKAAEVSAYRAPMLEAGNRSISLTDTIMAAGGVASGNVGGLLLGGANKLLREYGDVAAAKGADWVSGLGKRGRPATIADALEESAPPPVAAATPAPLDLAGRLKAGTVPDAELNYLRSGMRPKSLEAVRGGAGKGEPVRIDLQPGQPPILRDGRHRLQVARERGETHILATITKFDEELNELASETVMIPVPGAKETAAARVIGDAASAADSAAVKMSEGARAATSKGAQKTKAPEPRSDTFGQLAEQARTFKVDPARASARIAASISALAPSAPELTRAATFKATEDLGYLANSMPGAAKAGALPGIAEQADPAPSEEATFMRQARAVADPRSVIADFDAGRLSTDAVRALETRRPRLIEQIRFDVERSLAQMAARGEIPDRQRRLQIETLLGRVIDPASSPDVIRVVQQAYKKRAQAMASPPAPARASDAATKNEDRMMSQSETIARGDSNG